MKQRNFKPGNSYISVGGIKVKWSIYQVLTISFIILFMWFLEYINRNRTIQPSAGEWTAVNSVYVTFLIIALVVTCFYFIFLFEAKKENSFLQRSVWNIMPKVTVMVGTFSIVLFLIGGTIGPIMNWVEQWRSLLYVFLIYFLFLIFLFIFSFEHKQERLNQRSEKTVHISYIWTIAVFFLLFFLF